MPPTAPDTPNILNNRSPARALAILELLAEQGPQNNGEIATALGLPKSTLSTLLDILIEAGYVRRGPERRFVLSGRVLRLAQGFLAGSSWRDMFLPVLETLSKACAETAFLIGEDGENLVVLARNVVSQGLTYTMPIGAQLPLARTAGGMALLAFRPQARADETLAAIALGEVAYSDAGPVEGVVSLALPIRDSTGMPIASFSVALPHMRLNPERLESIKGALRNAQFSAEELIRTKDR
jgi:DNA-binding IclR family transcriptional regulator